MGAKFKAGRDVRLMPPAPVGAQPKVIPSDVIPSFAYGRKSRPSTPINAVVGYQYSAEYEEALANGYVQYQAQADASTAKTTVRLTKASRALIQGSKKDRANTVVEEPKPLFKLSKFNKVGSR